MASVSYDDADEIRRPLYVTLTPSESTHLKRVMLLRPGKPVVVGRASKSGGANTRPLESNTWFECPVISRQHAELKYSQGLVTLTDLGSMHGTFVNGKIVPKDMAIELQDGDKVQLGSDVSRGQDFYRGINLTINFDEPGCSDFVCGNSRFTVPVATDDDEDDEDDSDYASDCVDVFDSTDACPSSPQTSTSGNNDPLGSSPQKPITIDEQPPRPLPQVSLLADANITETAVPEKTTHDKIDIRQPVRPALECGPYPDRPASPLKNGWTGFPAFELPSPDYMLHQPVLPKSFEMRDPVLNRVINPSTLAQSPSKMAIPNMLAPAIEATTATGAPPPTANPANDPFHDPLKDLFACLDNVNPRPKKSSEASASKKRKQRDDFAAELEELSSYIQTRGACLSTSVDPISQVRTDLPSSSKRRRTSSRPVTLASHLVHETAKYSFGAAIGAVSTFAFLASPLGGRFADWLSTL